MRSFKMKDGHLTFRIYADGVKFTTAVTSVKINDKYVVTRATVEAKHGDAYHIYVGAHQAIRAAKIKIWARILSIMMQDHHRAKEHIFAGKVFKTNPFPLQLDVRGTWKKALPKVAGDGSLPPRPDDKALKAAFQKAGEEAKTRLEQLDIEASFPEGEQCP